MYRRGIQQVREAKSSRKKKDKAVLSFKKMAQKKNTPAVGSRTRLIQTQNWSWYTVNHCIISNLTNPINKTFLRLIHLTNSTFLSLKIIVDLLTIASCSTFLFLPHFDVICDLLLERCTATWNLFVKIMHALIGKFQSIIFIYMVYIGKIIKHHARLK